MQGERERSRHDERLHLVGLGAAGQLRAEPVDRAPQSGRGGGWIDDAHGLPDDGHVRDIGVGIDAAVVTELQICGQHRVDESHMDPFQETGILRGVAASVRKGSPHPAMHGADGCHRLFGDRHRAIRGGSDERPGALQPAERVLPVVGVPSHPRERQWVQRLHQQRPDSAEESGH